MFRINISGCLDRCELGPTMVIYPEGVWYSVQTTADVDEILKTHVNRLVPSARRLTRGGAVSAMKWRWLQGEGRPHAGQVTGSDNCSIWGTGRAKAAVRFFCRSATPPAIGATSWRTSLSRTPKSRRI